MMMSLLPDPKEYPENRLFSLDLLRGLDMFYLAVVSAVLPPLFAALGLSPAWKDFFCTHPWEGFTLYDIIMPLFIFMSGAAVPFALGRRLQDGRATAGFHRHVWSRVALLWVLGMLAQGQLASLDVHCLSPYNNTLQTIAVGYAATAYLMLAPRRWVRVVVPTALLALYGLIVHFGGDYTKGGNVTQPVELAILNSFLPADNKQTANIVKYGYTWFLPSLVFPFIAMAGAQATEILRTRTWGEWKRAGVLAGSGLASLVLGLLLEGVGVKCVKHIFSVSFTLQAVGWSMLALAVCFVVTDIWKVRRGMGLLLLFGQFALAAYLCEAVFRQACYGVRDRLFGGVVALFPAPWASVVSMVAYGLVVIAALVIWRGYKQSRKA